MEVCKKLLQFWALAAISVAYSVHAHQEQIQRQHSSKFRIVRLHQYPLHYGNILLWDIVIVPHLHAFHGLRNVFEAQPAWRNIRMVQTPFTFAGYIMDAPMSMSTFARQKSVKSLRYGFKSGGRDGQLTFWSPPKRRYSFGRICSGRCAKLGTLVPLQQRSRRMCWLSWWSFGTRNFFVIGAPDIPIWCSKKHEPRLKIGRKSMVFHEFPRNLHSSAHL